MNDIRIMLNNMKSWYFRNYTQPDSELPRGWLYMPNREPCGELRLRESEPSAGAEYYDVVVNGVVIAELVREWNADRPGEREFEEEYVVITEWQGLDTVLREGWTMLPVELNVVVSWYMGMSFEKTSSSYRAEHISGAVFDFEFK